MEAVCVASPAAEDDDNRLLFQRVDEPKTAKNRVHIDIHVPDGERDAHVAQLISLGATKLWDAAQGPMSWDTLADPEGNDSASHNARLPGSTRARTGLTGGSKCIEMPQGLVAVPGFPRPCDPCLRGGTPCPTRPPSRSPTSPSAVGRCRHRRGRSRRALRLRRAILAEHPRPLVTLARTALGPRPRRRSRWLRPRPLATAVELGLGHHCSGTHRSSAP